jgi:AcrR family transcriptional regulator
MLHCIQKEFVMPKKELLDPRKMPSQARARKTMSAIYEAAAYIFDEIGYAEATTDQIAQKAGVSIGTLYNYFPGKEAILHGLWEKTMQEIKTITQQMDQEIRKQGSVDRSIIPDLLSLVLDLFSYQRLPNRLFISQVGLPEIFIQKRKELGLYMESTTEEIFRDFANVRIRNPKVGVHILWAAVQAVIHDYMLSTSEEIKSEELINELSDMIGRYIFTDNTEK